MADSIFFSYSRFDSAFVLRLANDLRNAGVNIWLDQLDIAPGKRWDSEIEKALTIANCLLAIISPKSLLSENAMDEISFALEEKKRVIPVMLTKTETPFRLRRLQRVDFTEDYDTGFNHLLQALDAEHPIAPAKTTEALSEQGVALDEEKRWATCCSANSLAGYQHYLRTTHSKRHLDEAWVQMDKLQEIPASRVIKLPPTALKKKSLIAKKSMMVAAAFVAMVIVAFGAYSIISKNKTEGSAKFIVSESMPDSNARKQNDMPITPKEKVDTPASVAEQAEQQTTTNTEKRPKAEQTPQRRPDVITNNKTIIEPPPSPHIEDSIPVPPPAVPDKKPIVIRSKVVVSLLLIGNPDMHQRKKSEQFMQFSVTNNVVYDGQIIIRQGATARGSLTVGSKFTDIRIRSVEGADGTVISLISEKERGIRNEVETNKHYSAFIKEGSRIGN